MSARISSKKTSCMKPLDNHRRKLKPVLHYLLYAACLFPTITSAKPLIEAGMGIGSVVLPHYLGSDQTSRYTIPIPYLIYRGDLVNADRSGLQGFIYNSEKLDLRLSFGGALPVNSEDNTAREGMENLDLMVEIGPNLEYQLLKTDNQLLRLDFPFRAAFTLGSPFMHYQGWTTNPGLHHIWEKHNLRLTTTAGLVFSDAKYHAYIYDVSAEDVLDDRPLYESKRGFTGSRRGLAAKYQWHELVVGANIHYYNLKNARNLDSPLIKQTDYTSFGLYFAWIFFQSSQQQSSHIQEL